MGCINISSRTYGDPVDQFYEFWTPRQPDGRYAEGSWQTAHRSTVYMTPEQNREKAIQATIDYLGVPRNVICGEENYLSAETIARLAAEAEATAAAEREAALQREAEQLRLKSAMLQSQNAVWSDPDTYKAEVAETTQEIRAYNSDVAAFLATAPGQPGVTDSALLRKPAEQSQPATAPGSVKSNSGTALLIAAGLTAAAIAAIAIAGRKK